MSYNIEESSHSTTPLHTPNPSLSVSLAFLPMFCGFHFASQSVPSSLSHDKKSAFRELHTAPSRAQYTDAYTEKFRNARCVHKNCRFCDVHFPSIPHKNSSSSEKKPPLAIKFFMNAQTEPKVRKRQKSPSNFLPTYTTFSRARSHILEDFRTIVYTRLSSTRRKTICKLYSIQFS